MAISVAIPKLGVEMTSAKLVEWREENGAKIEKGQIVAVIETDKLTNELESPGAGYLVHVGELEHEYDIGVEIAKLVDSAEEALGGGSPAPAAADAPAVESAPAADAAPAAAASPAPAAGNDTWVHATPLARVIAQARGIDLHKVTGTGFHGTIKRKDVDSYIEPAPAQKSAPAAATPAQTAPAAPAPQALPGKAVREERPFSSARAAVARHMLQSLATSAQMTDIRHLEVSNFIAYRNRLAAKADLMGFKVSYLDLTIKAVANILKKLPEFNASVGDNKLIVWDNINIGIAVANDQGLIVPVLHDADKLSLAEIHAQSQELIEKAREQRLLPEDISGGTFTISNYGSFGSEGGTPVINMPQVAILGIGAMMEAPVVKDGALAVGHVMCTSLTLDHRVLDGQQAAAFQNQLKRYMEDPELILID